MFKVSWPQRDELIGSTMVVLIITLIFALFIFGIDQLLSKLVQMILG